jgi:S-DNA-T family DNA segregation ATPase FtsK/SpoIIIE
MGGFASHGRSRRLPPVSSIAGDARSVVRVTLRLADGAERDVEIEGAGSATAGEVAAALGSHAGAPARDGLHCLRLGPLPCDLALHRSGLRDGDVLALHPLGRATADTLSGSGAPVAELVVVGGPAAGRRVGLTIGSHTIGRDPGVDVTIDDPSMSGRHLELRIAAQGVAILDVGSSNGTAVDGLGLAAGEPRPLGPAEQVEAGRSLLAIRPWRSPDPTVLGARRDVMAFNRPPRVARPYEPPTLRVDAPPPPPRRVRMPLLAALVPLVMGLSLFLITSSPYLLLMAGLSPMMLLSTFIGDRSSGRKEHARARAGFEEAVARLEQQLEHRRREEIAERRAVAPDAGELAVRARRLLPELWERRPGDGDFLDVRLGVADQPSIVSVAFGQGGDPELRAIVEELVARYRDVPAVPVRAQLAQVGAIGLAGHESYVESLARWIVVQLATLHSPRDVVIAAALSPERARTWGWLGWLPHTTNAGSPLEGAHVVAGQTAAYALVKDIATLARERREEDAGRVGRRRRRRVAVVLLVDEDVAPDRTTVDELLDGCAAVDVAAIWLARERRDLPGGCGAIVELAGDRAVADVTWAASGQRIAAASADGMSLQTAVSVARALAPVRDVSAGGGAADLPRTVSLTQLLDLPEPTGEQVAERWRSTGAAGLRGLIGVTVEGPYAIDLRADGPHALVGGTTGSGKSELLQTLIASLAVSVPPDRLAFLLVDYKGGAAFKDCRHLPHSAGMVTDLDEHEVHRALVSLEAELKRREEVLRAAGAKDLLELERRAPATAPPSLVIVVDEFATLAREVPAFVEGIVDVAQRGRSLGVHVVLATQRPSGAVTDNIRANTELRIALRVAGVAESEDVVNAPDAARLPRSVPGRALARTGPSELTLFQAAYVGGRTARVQPDRGVVVRDLRFGVPEAPRAAQGGADSEHEAVTDLLVLVEAAREAAEREGVRLPAAPWLPALPDVVAPAEAAALADPAAARDSSAVLGIVDEPRRQRRTAALVDLARDGNLLVYGGTGAGKTTVLRTLAAGLAGQAPPAELWLYGLDFAGRGLAGVEALPHCGSIVPGDDEERVVRLLASLRRAIDDRGRRFAARGVLTLDEYRRAAPDDPLARIVVLVDSYAGFVDSYEKVDLGVYVDALPRLVADGRAAGVHFVVTGDRRMAIPQSIAGVVARRLILRLADEHELSSLGLDAREVRGARLPPGRGFLDDGRELQVAVLGEDGSGERQNAALSRLGAELAARHAGAGAPPIKRMPTELARSALPRRASALQPVLGVDDIDLSPVVLALDDGHAAIVGSYRSGRTTALETIARSLREAPATSELHLLAPRRSQLTELDLWTSVARGMDACEARVPELVEEVYARSGDGGEPPLVIVVDDAGELAEAVCAGAIETLLRRGRDRDVHVVAALERGQARHYAPWIRELRKDGAGLLLDPDLDLDGELLGVRLPRRSNAFFPPGRGYLVAGGSARLIQVAS